MDDGGGTTRPARVAPPRYDIDAALADGRAPTPFPTIGLGGGGDLLTGDAGAPRLAPPPRPASRAVRHEDALQAEIDKLLAKQQEAERAKAEATKERVPSEKHTVELGPRPESMDGRRRRAGDPENRPVHVAYELLGPATGVRVVVTPRTRKARPRPSSRRPTTAIPPTSRARAPLAGQGQGARHRRAAGAALQRARAHVGPA